MTTRTTLFRSLLALLCFVSLTATAWAQPIPVRKQQLSTLKGTYADPTSYAYGKAWGKRVFTFDNGKWTLVFVLALDSALQAPVFEFRTVGTYQVQEASSVVPHAWNARFVETHKYLTLKTTDAGLAQAFGLANCGLTPNVEKDISISGCSLWKPVAQCNEDYDLLALDAKGRLYFGQRPPDNDMCTPDKRPSRLTPPVEQQANRQSSR